MCASHRVNKPATTGKVKDAVPLVCDKDDAAWVFDKDDGSTRYVLPVIEQKEAA